MNYPFPGGIIKDAKKRRIILREIFKLELKYSIKYGLVYTLGNDLKEVAVWRKSISAPTAFSYLRFMTPTVLRFVTYISISEYKLLNHYIKILESEKKQLKLPDNTMELMFLAVLPESQGEGRSSALLNPVLECMDRKNTHCLLLTNSEKNETIYKKKGFRTIRFYYEEKTCTENYFMLREPRIPK